MASYQIEIITQSTRMERWLEPYRSTIGGDFEGYRNHLYRVLNYCNWFLDDDQTHRPEIEFALVFHDIGLWTNRELAYLEPSIKLALEVNADDGLGFDPLLIKDLIFYHHKFLSYSGRNRGLVNAFRKADWVDATKGSIKNGMDPAFMEKVNQAFPAAGFYDTLARLGPELSGNNTFKMIGDFLKIYKF